MDLPYAEDVNYWKTGQSQPDKWLENASRLIEKLGGNVAAYAFGVDQNTGKRAYMFAFEIQGQAYKIVWPILESKSCDEPAAKRQAATFLFHDIKAKCLSATVIGPQKAFFNYLLLPDGRTAQEATFGELAEGIPYISRKMIEK